MLLLDRLPFFSKVMKGCREQKIPSDSPFLSKVTFVDVLLRGLKFKEERQDLKSAC